MFKIKKNVDWSLLHQGLTIPVNMHEEISQKLEIGEKRPIVIHLNNVFYQATLYNLDFDRQKYPDHSEIIQIRYNPDSKITKALRDIFHECYARLAAAKQQAKGKCSTSNMCNDYVILTETATQNVYEMTCSNSDTLSESKKLLEKYVDSFQSLKRGGTPHGPAPHKIILLLAIIDCINNGCFIKNEIKITKELMSAYTATWTQFFSNDISFNRGLELPYYHLKNDGFWHLKANPGKDDLLQEQKSGPTLKKLQNLVEYAYFDKDLYELFQIAYCRNMLQQTLEKQLPAKRQTVAPSVKKVENIDVILPENKSLSQACVTIEKHETSKKTSNNTRYESLPDDLQLICNYLDNAQKKTFTIAELMEDENVQTYLADLANPLTKLRHIVTDHADETYPHFKKRKMPICFSKLSSTEWQLRSSFKQTFNMQSKQSMNYAEWAACLHRHFFPHGKKNENKHLFLCDGYVLCLIWSKNPLLVQEKDYDYIVSDFVAAVIEKARDKDFMKFFQKAPDLKYRHLPFLCLQSLAWQYELPNLRRASNYYERLRGLLQWAAAKKNLPLPAFDGKLKNEHDELWEKLDQALRRNNAGSIILPIDKKDKHIAYASLHSVFKREDSRRLYLYFAMQNINNVQTMRDAKEIFYAVKKQSNDVSIFNEEYTSMVGNCIKDYFLFWNSKYCGKTFDPFSSPRIKYAFFNILGSTAYNEHEVITEEVGRQLYEKLQEKNRFLKNQDFRPGFIFYMNLARESWIENSCHFNWTTPEILQKLSRYAQDHAIEEFTNEQAHEAYLSLSLPYPWREWMSANISDVLKEKTTPIFQLEADCRWQVLCGHNRIYPVLAFDDVDDTYYITQRGRRELQLQNDTRWISIENLHSAGFNLRETMQLVNKEQKWKKKIIPFAPQPFDPPHIYRVDYQDYADRINPGDHLGTIETLLAVFPNSLQDDVQQVNLPKLQGCDIEPFLESAAHGNYIAAILHVNSDRITWDSELLVASEPSPYLVFPSFKIRSKKISIAVTAMNDSLPEVRNGITEQWLCDNQPVTAAQVKYLPCGLHTLHCILQNGRKIKKDVFVVPANLEMKTCQITDWTWTCDIHKQESHLLEKQLLSATLTKEDQTIDCFFEMPEDSLFWWNYRIGDDYTINTPIHYNSLSDYLEMHELLKLVPDKLHEFTLYCDDDKTNPAKCYTTFHDLKRQLSTSLNNFLLFDKRVTVTINNQEIFSIDIIPVEGECYDYAIKYNPETEDYLFHPSEDNSEYQWKVHPEQLIEALHHEENCYIRGTWKGIEIFLPSHADRIWWLEKDGKIYNFMQKIKLKTLQELRTYSLFFLPENRACLQLGSNGKTIEKDIPSVKMMYNAIQSNMNILSHQPITIYLDWYPIIEIDDVFSDYSFVLGKEFLFQNIPEKSLLICQLDLNSIFYNKISTLVTNKPQERLDNRFKLDGTQYFLALDIPLGETVPQNCNDLLDILEKYPEYVETIFCYEQMPYLNYSLHEVLSETEENEKLMCNHAEAEERLQRFKNMQHFENEFFTEELRFADGLHEQYACRSTMSPQSHNLEYFLRNGFENWFLMRHVIYDMLATSNNSKTLNEIEAHSRESRGLDSYDLKNLYNACVNRWNGDILASIRNLRFCELDDLLPCMESSVKLLIRLLESDKLLSTEMKRNLKTLFIAFAALKTLPRKRELKYSLSYFFYDLLYCNNFTTLQQKYIHALFMTLSQYNLSIGENNEPARNDKIPVRTSP